MQGWRLTVAGGLLAVASALQTFAMHQGVLQSAERRSFRLRSCTSCRPPLLEEAADDISVLLSQFEPEGLRQHMLETIQSSARRFALLLDSAAEGMVGVDGSGNCAFTNSPVLHMLQIHDASKALGSHMHELLHPPTTACCVETCELAQTIAGGGDWHSDDMIVYPHRQDPPLAVEMWIHPAEADESSLAAVLSFVDSSERKQREEQSREYTARLERFQRAAIAREWRVKELREENLQLTRMSSDTRAKMKPSHGCCARYHARCFMLRNEHHRGSQGHA